jgi:hypothetical protein
MAKVNDLVSRGVRLLVAEPGASGEWPEIPADFFSAPEVNRVTRFDLPVDTDDFAEVYDEARVPEPFRGYGIDKLVSILESKRLASLPQDVRIAAAIASLDAAGVTLPQVLRDAAIRDRALEDFVAAKEREVSAVQHRNEAHIAALKEELDAYVESRQREIESLQNTADGSGTAFGQLQLRKRQEQERLREIVSHFVPPEQNPIPVPRKAARLDGEAEA